MGAVTPWAKERDRERHRELKKWYKDHGLCERCGRCPPMIGRVYCKECYTRILYMRDQRDPTHEKRKAYNRERRARLKAEGICIWCGKRKAVEGQIHCPTCKRKQKESQQVYEIKKRIKEGKA